MAEDYEYDVFVSYRRKQPVMDWVKNHFHPLLEQWLPNAMPAWQDWPVLTPIANEQVVVKLPRL